MSSVRELIQLLLCRPECASRAWSLSRALAWLYQDQNFTVRVIAQPRIFLIPPAHLSTRLVTFH